MKTKKIIGAALTAIFLATGCASNPMAAVYDDDTAIASDTNTYNLYIDGQTSADGHFTASVEKMEGMDTIWVFEAQEAASIDITYAIQVSSGKMKLVLINPEGEVSIITECDSEMAEPMQSSLNVGSGNNRIKIVADENTKFDIDISIPDGEFKKLG